MAYRGRLIFPVIARIAPVAPAATTYDDDFREPVRDPDGSQLGLPGRQEGDVVDVLAQVEDQSWDALQVLRGGDSPLGEIRVVVHRLDLQRAGLLDVATNEPIVPRKGDRLVSIHRKSSLELIHAVPTPPGLYCVEVRPNMGLAGDGNLLVAEFRTRDVATRVG